MSLGDECARMQQLSLSYRIQYLQVGVWVRLRSGTLVADDDNLRHGNRESGLSLAERSVTQRYTYLKVAREL